MRLAIELEVVGCGIGYLVEHTATVDRPAWEIGATGFTQILSFVECTEDLCYGGAYRLFHFGMLV